MKSIAQKLTAIHGLCGTNDINSWEENFIQNMVVQSHQIKDTTFLTGKQAEAISNIHKKHFESERSSWKRNQEME